MQIASYNSKKKLRIRSNSAIIYGEYEANRIKITLILADFQPFIIWIAYSSVAILIPDCCWMNSKSTKQTV